LLKPPLPPFLAGGVFFVVRSGCGREHQRGDIAGDVRGRGRPPNSICQLQPLPTPPVGQWWPHSTRAVPVTKNCLTASNASD
jgi:hypothetical protein